MGRKVLKWLVFVGALGVIAFFAYRNQLIFRYAVPPGGDAINHNRSVELILQGKIQEAIHYHIVWHLIVAGVSRLTGTLPITVMAWMGPGILVVGSAVLFIFNWRYFGFIAGLVSAIVLGLMSFQPLQTLNDGGFPNVLATTIVLPLTLMSLIFVLTGRKKALAIPLFLVMLVILLFSHNFTPLYGLATMAIFTVLAIPIWLRRRGYNYLIVFGSLAASALLGLASASILLKTASLSATGLAAAYAKIDLVWPFFHLIGKLDNPNAILDIFAYPDAIGPVLLYLGLPGVLVAAGYLLFDGWSRRAQASLLLLIWATLVFGLSQSPQVGFPVRLTRDLAVPLALLSGIAVGAVVDLGRWRRIPPIFVGFFLLETMAFGLPALTSRYEQAGRHNPLVSHLEVDRRMAARINAQIPKNSVIFIPWDDIYLPLFIEGYKPLIEIPDATRLKITNPAELPIILPSVQYVYFEYRLDRPVNWNNNRANLNSYLNSSVMTLMFKDSQPEKEVYFFKVVRPKSALVATR
jgi:hypothetical protein